MAVFWLKNLVFDTDNVVAKPPKDLSSFVVFVSVRIHVVIGGAAGGPVRGGGLLFP